MSSQPKQTSAFSQATLLKALLVSLMLHAVFLLQTPQMPDDTGKKNVHTSTRPLKAHLEPHTSPSPQFIPLQKPEPRQIRNAPQPPQSTPTPSFQPAQIQQISDTPQQPRTPASWVSHTSPAPRSQANTPLSEETTDADGLRQYRIELAITARRFREQTIPVQAQADEGTVGIRVNIEPKNPVPAVALQSSSGNTTLDQAAITLLDHASRIAPVPPSLRDKAFSVVLRVEFSLDP